MKINRDARPKHNDAPKPTGAIKNNRALNVTSRIRWTVVVSSSSAVMKRKGALLISNGKLTNKGSRISSDGKATNSAGFQNSEISNNSSSEIGSVITNVTLNSRDARTTRIAELGRTRNAMIGVAARRIPGDRDKLILVVVNKIGSRNGSSATST